MDGSKMSSITKKITTNYCEENNPLRFLRNYKVIQKSKKLPDPCKCINQLLSSSAAILFSVNLQQGRS